LKSLFTSVTLEGFSLDACEALGGCLDVTHGAVSIVVRNIEQLHEIGQAVVGHLGMQLARETQGVNVVAGERPVQVAIEGIVEEVDVEADAMPDNGCIPNEGCELLEHVGSKWSAFEHLVGNSRQCLDEVIDEGSARHARRLDERAEAPNLLAVRDFDGRNFDDVIPLGATPSSLDIDHAVRVGEGDNAASLRFADRLRVRQGIQGCI